MPTLLWGALCLQGHPSAECVIASMGVTKESPLALSCSSVATPAWPPPSSGGGTCHPHHHFLLVSSLPSSGQGPEEPFWSPKQRSLVAAYNPQELPAPASDSMLCCPQSLQLPLSPLRGGQQCSRPCWASWPLTGRRQCRCLLGRYRGAASWTRVPRGCRGWSPGCRHTATRGMRSLRWGRHEWLRAWAAHGCGYPPHLQGLRPCQQGGSFSQRVLECPPVGHLTLVSRLQGTIKEVCVSGDASAYQIILLYTLNIYNSKLSVQPQ